MATVVNINPVRANRFYRSRATTFVSATPSQQHITLVDLTPVELLLKDLELGYETLKPIPVQVQRYDDGFIASFNAANIHASGDTLLDAAVKLRSLLLDIFDSLLDENPLALGRETKRQLSILLEYVQKANT